MAEGKIVRKGGGVNVNDATATENDVLQGETFYSGDKDIKTGNIPSKGAETFTPSTSNQTISSGQYLSGTQTILGDNDLVPENIKDGVSIFGVTGTLEELDLSQNLYAIWSANEQVAVINPDTKLYEKAYPRPNDIMSIGGMGGRLFGSGRTPQEVIELNPSTLEIINSATSPDNRTDGIGGTSTRLYCVDVTSDRLYELDPDTLLSLASTNTPSDAPRGCGGTNNRLYTTDSNTDRIYEHDLDTRISISSVSSPSSSAWDVGGLFNRLYHVDLAAARLYELDLDTKLSINSVSSPMIGIGGLKQ